MELKIYVVTTENPDKTKLDAVKVELCGQFGGLTVINNCEGLWIDNGKLFLDNVQIWVIVTNGIVKPQDAIRYGEQLKNICHQKSQLLTINGTAYFV